MNQNLAPQPKPNATLLLLTAWAIALVGYFGPWLGRPSAALAWNAYDLFDLLRLLPEIEAGALIVNLQALRLPLVGLAVLLPMMLANARLPSRLTAALLGIGLALTTLPSYPEIVRAWRLPGWRVPFWWGVGAMVGAVAAVWLAPRLGATRPWLCLARAHRHPGNDHALPPHSGAEPPSWRADRPGVGILDVRRGDVHHCAGRLGPEHQENQGGIQCQRMTH
jgi:hypothetical protein